MKHIIYILLLLISFLPFKVLYSISMIISLINNYLIKYRAEVILKNITLSFPALNSIEKKRFLFKFYIKFFNTIVEIIKSLSLDKREIEKRIKINNINIIEQSIKRKKSIILVGSHLGNWEWLLLRLSLIKNINLSAVYKPLSNKWINYIMLKIRTKFNTSLIPLDKWHSFILKNRNTPSTIFFVTDQVPENNKSSIRINFLNQSTLFHLGPEKTSKLLEAEVYYINLTIQKTGFYDVHFQTLKKEDITKSYVNLLEKNIKKQPLYWLWSHRRWKR